MGRLDKAMTLEEYRALRDDELRDMLREEYGDVPRDEASRHGDAGGGWCKCGRRRATCSG